MSDLEKSAFAAAKQAAERALDDALLSDEERQKRRAAEGALARRKRNVRIARVAVGSLLAVGLVGLMLHYWYWALLLGLVGVAALYGRHRWRARRASRAKPEAAAPREAPVVKARVAPDPVRVEDPVADASVDDDLAELKARLKR